MWRKKNPCVLLVKMQIGTVVMENNIGFPKKINTRITIGSSNPSSGYTFEENKITILRGYMYSHV